MKGRFDAWILVSGVSALALLSFSGCAKEVKANFPRPPATATLPLPEERDDAEPADETAPDDGTAEEESPGTVEAESSEAPAEASRPEPPGNAREPEPAGPAPPPPSTQMGERGVPEDTELTVKLRRAGTLLSSVNLRELSSGQRQQLSAARTFVTQARRALREGDERRALVLLDKGLILAEDLERSSRR